MSHTKAPGAGLGGACYDSGLQTGHKEEFPPLFASGLHQLTLGDLRKRCVDAFPDSVRRITVMDGLQRLHDKFIEIGLDESELWVDGSFLTQKQEPDDVDILLIAPATFLDSGTPEQAEMLDSLTEDNKRLRYREEYYCDTHCVLTYPTTSYLSVMSQAYILRYQFAFGHSVVTQKPKGIATIAVVQQKEKAVESSGD